ncbi:MAG: cysteine desulfurase [Coxiellaceae bacterium]|nr:cysteine desulfurase [Coxiellaceae bacterium]
MTHKKNFPIFDYHPDLIYLDSAASTQKPRCVIDTEKKFYEESYATVHRGVYALSQHSTLLYEAVREKTRVFLNAQKDHEIIFTKGTTESINLLAHSYGLSHFQAGDEIILSVAEHHANIVPWQQVCEKTGAKIVVVPLLENGELDLDAYQKAFTRHTKFVAITHISNVLGVINPVKKIVEIAHAHNALVMLDGAQAVAHVPVDVQALDCDFYVLSAHKLYGPTGVGILYGKEKYLEKMTPYQTGGHMIRSVTFEKTEFGELPLKFEAGTPNIAGVVGLGAAIDYVTTIGFDAIRLHEKELLAYAITELQKIVGLKMYGTASDKIGVISFSFAEAHPHDIATILDKSHIALRGGHHCTMPLMQYYNVAALTRASFSIYNEKADVDTLVLGLEKVRTLFSL